MRTPYEKKLRRARIKGIIHGLVLWAVATPFIVLLVHLALKELER